MKNKIPLIALSAVCIVAVIGMVLALTLGKQNTSKFIPPEFDKTAQSGAPTVPDNLGYTPVEVTEGYKAYVCGAITEQDGKVDVFFTSDKDNTVWLKLRMLDEGGNTLGETGVIKPGEYVQSIKLETVRKSTEKVKLKIIAYTPDTWYSAGTAALNTTLTKEK